MVPTVQSQEYGDPDFYLIDSLNLERLNDWDRELIDSTLNLYHQTKNDTIQLELLEHLVDNCWNERVWPRYNNFMILQVKKNLSQNSSVEVQLKNKYFLAGALNNIGLENDQKGRLGDALNYYHEALRLYEEVGNQKGMSVTLNNLSVIHSILGNFEKSIIYQKESIRLKREIRDHEGITVSYINLGHVYENKKSHFEALEYYEKALAIGLEYNDTRGTALAYSKIGDIYELEEVYPKALSFNLKSLELWQEIGSDVGISMTSNSIGSVLLQQGKYYEAKKYAEKSLAIALELDYPQDIQNAAKTLSFIHEDMRNYKAALEYFQLYTEMESRLINDETEKKAYKISMQYEYEREALKDSLEYAKREELNTLALKNQQAENYALYGGLILMAIILFLGWRSLQHRKRVNELVQQQKEQVEVRKEEIEQKHQVLSIAHKEISDSISYAQRIQRAILPSEEKLNQLLGQGFVLFKPKDIVSGDFYWLEEVDNELIFAVADCTGHGVPGAMVSVVCHNALNRSVREFDLRQPADILNKTRELVIEAFSANKENVRDGMDISLCRLNINTRDLQWAGAYNPLYLIRSQETEGIVEYLADKQPVGRYQKAQPFTNHRLQLKTGDQLYLFSDGYPDQFGGPKGKKLKYSAFKELLLQCFSLSPDEQRRKLNDYFEQWKGDMEQIDDVCIVGLKV